ncbi:MAG: hypothetical protein WCE54_16300 [Ignavibacteriaceae bacterium]
MFTTKHFINLFSSSVIGIVSLIFVYKYSLIYFNRPVLLALVYALLFLFVVLSFDKIRIIPGRTTNNKYFIFTVLFFCLLLLYYIFFTTKADGSFGLLAIKNWLNNFFNGTFPYLLKNTFPAYPSFYLIFSPFYLAGNILLLEILIWVILAIFLVFNSATVREKIIKLFFLLVSPLTFYGLFEASIYFLNAVIFIVLILLSEKYLNPHKVDKSFILFAVVFGLFFSINIEVIAVLIIYMLYFFRNDLRELSLFLEILLAVFLITIIPFIVWNPILFFINGPLNSLFKIPWWGIFIYLGIAAYAGWLVSDLQEIFFAIGILLIIPSVINSLYINTGISGFIFALPFLIFSIKDYRVKKFTGKIFINEN